MPWFAAHVVLRVSTQPETKEVYIWENVYLLNAKDHEAARPLALKRAEAAIVPDPSFTWDGRPASWSVAGVRKVVSCDEEDQRPGDGTEITYTQFKFADAGVLRRFLDEEIVDVVYEE